MGGKLALYPLGMALTGGVLGATFFGALKLKETVRVRNSPIVEDVRSLGQHGPKGHERSYSVVEKLRHLQ